MPGRTGRHDHSDNRRAPGPGSLKQRTAVQFSAEDDVLALLEEHPALRSPALVARLQGVRRRLLDTGLDGAPPESG
jgi:hypothetical protein